jgi:protein-tyrosine phosphatase
MLFVCLGNVCRSPLAERLLTLRLETLLGPRAANHEVSSAGLRALVGSPMHDVSAAELMRLGGDPSGFVSRQVTAQMVDQAELVLTATREIRSRVLEEAPRALKRTFTIRELEAIVMTDGFWDQQIRSTRDLVAKAASWRGAASTEDFDVPDPIGQGADVHREVADLLDAACTTIARAVAEAELSDVSR